MKKYIAVMTTLVIAAAVLAGCAGGAFAQAETPSATSNDTGNSDRTLSVSGSGKVYLTPDIAYVTIGVHTENADAKKAVSDNNAGAKKVIDSLKTLGIDAKDIQTTNFSIYPQQQYDNQGKPTGKITYIVDNSVFVTVRDLEKIGDVLDQSVEAGANSISGIQFDVADKTAAESQARSAAVDDAANKAQELANAAGVSLGPVMTINESISGGPLPKFEARAAMVAESPVPVEAGQMVLTINVNMIYQIQ
jgi:uncharacterized protein YggE